MIKWLIRFFRRDRKVVYPFRGMNDQMRRKDPELYQVVGPMPVASGIRKWREKYPEDFSQMKY